MPFIFLYALPVIAWEEISDYINAREAYKQHLKWRKEREEQTKKEN